ncbi:MAG: hypoxanthine phosphoribosyltransferase [Bacteroidales bacterium]|nr:hypoxanthine phosphoribosyltransferase [Bacteroidales bacterium]
MEKVTIYDKKFVKFISHRDIISAIEAVSRQVNEDYCEGEDIPVVLCVMNGALLFAGELIQRLNFPLEIKTVKLASYEGTESSGKIREVQGIPGSVKDRHVIIVEDIVDTGATVEYLCNSLKEKGAADVKICTMLLKPEMYDRDIPLDYVAKEIPNRFIVGFGLDYNELGRNLKDIYVLE